MRNNRLSVRITQLRKSRRRTIFRPIAISSRGRPLRVFRDLIIFREIEAQMRNSAPPMFHVKHSPFDRDEAPAAYISTNAHMNPRFTDSANAVFPVGSIRK
jgi:hypothetical protein